MSDTELAPQPCMPAPAVDWRRDVLTIAVLLVAALSCATVASAFILLTRGALPF